MSFILDALKKSETDRQRQNGPALFEVRAAPPRDKLPLWAVGLGALLAVNLVIVAWVLLRRPASADAAAQSAAAAGVQPQQSGQGQYAAAGAGAMGGSQGQQQGWGAQGQGGQGPTGQGQGQQGQGQQGPGMQQGSAMSQGGNGAGPGGYGAPGNGSGSGGYGPSANGGSPGGYAASANGGGPGGYGAPSNGGGSGGYGAPGNGGPAGYGAPAYGTVPSGPMAQTAGLTAGQQPGMTQQGPANGQAPVAGNGSSQGGEKLNPDDYAPAAEPAPQPFGNHVTRATSSGVPLYNDVAATTQLPSLRLDLHVYAANPQERFVMINMRKLHEGDLMNSEGVRVESITPYGAVLSRNGKQFLLPRD
jgi:hypothetical protein